MRAARAFNDTREVLIEWNLGDFRVRALGATLIFFTFPIGILSFLVLGVWGLILPLVWFVVSFFFITFLNRHSEEGVVKELTQINLLQDGVRHRYKQNF